MDISHNILKWYPFRENSSVLEIYDETSIMKNLNKNIILTTCNVNEFQIQGEYDYITLIGTYEKAPIIIKDKNSYSELLKMLKKHLKPNGIILLAIDNRLGVKYLSGAKNKNYSHIFEGIESKIRNGQPNLLLKQEIIKFIKEAEFKDYKFYYPLPDYKHTNSIFTDEFLPKSNQSKILYPVHYEDGSIVVYNEINLIKQICDIGQFDNFTNAYFVEISNEEISNEIKFVNYNYLRKDKYKLLLTINGKYVEKIPENEVAKTHINNIKTHIERLTNLGFNVLEKVENEKIISEFINCEQLDQKMVNILVEKDKNEFLNEIKVWYVYIKEKLEKENIIDKDIFGKYEIEIPKEQKEKLHFVKDGYIDLSFENIFCKEEFLLYDQEWYLENVPLEFILYRAINNLYTYNNRKLENKILKEEVYKEFDLDEHIAYFDELERKIQSEILDGDAVEFYQNEIKKYYKIVESFENTINQKDDEIKYLKEQYAILKNEKTEIEDAYKEVRIEKENIEGKYAKLFNEYNTSTGWKVIKGVRKFFGKG